MTCPFYASVVMIRYQYHEQNHANVKGSGNQWALRCWMIAGQEIGKIRMEVEEQMDGKSISRTQPVLTSH